MEDKEFLKSLDEKDPYEKEPILISIYNFICISIKDMSKYFWM